MHFMQIYKYAIMQLCNNAIAPIAQGHYCNDAIMQ